MALRLICPSISVFVVALGGLCVAGLRAAEPPSGERSRVSLDGTWSFRLDPKGEGVAEGWFGPGIVYPDQIAVPGNWQAQSFGPPRGHLRHDYQGVAWYRRTFEVPAGWAGRRVWLDLGGVTAFGDVYVNGRKVGTAEHYLTPHEFDVTDAVRPGPDNVIACRVDSVASSHDPHGEPVVRPGPVGMFNFWGHWGGLYRPVWLEARPDPSIDTVFVEPDVRRKVARVRVTLRREVAGAAWGGKVRVLVTPMTPAAAGTPATAPAAGPSSSAQGSVRFAAGQKSSDEATVEVPVEGARLWSPEDPFLYELRAVLEDDAGYTADLTRSRFGMREVAAGADGTLLLNGRPYFVRGLGRTTSSRSRGRWCRTSGCAPSGSGCASVTGTTGSASWDTRPRRNCSTRPTRRGS